MRGMAVPTTEVLSAGQHEGQADAHHGRQVDGKELLGATADAGGGVHRR